LNTATDGAKREATLLLSRKQKQEEAEETRKEAEEARKKAEQARKKAEEDQFELHTSVALRLSLAMSNSAEVLEPVLSLGSTSYLTSSDEVSVRITRSTSANIKYAYRLVSFL
jgi:hypothetical protein